MSYEKYTWHTGEVITAEKLNHMEDGIEAAGSDGGIEYVGEFSFKNSQSTTVSHENGATVTLDKATNIDDGSTPTFDSEATYVCALTTFNMSSVIPIGISPYIYEGNVGGNCYVVTRGDTDVAISAEAITVNCAVFKVIASDEGGR